MKILFNLLGVIVTLSQFAGSSAALPGAAPTSAPPASSKTDGPRIRFSETDFNFGTVKPSDVLKHDFIVTNTGNSVLEISDVHPGCGCTTAGAWDRKIQPGQTGKIPIQLNPGGFSGAVTKFVSVTCDDPTQANHSLQIHATIWRPIDAQPAHVYFTPIEGEATNETKTVRIINNLDEPVTLEPPQCSNPAYKMELKTTKPGKEFQLSVTYAPPISNASPQGQIMIKTSTTNMSVLSVTAYAMLQPALVAMPSQISLPPRPSSGSYMHSAIIRNNGSTPVKLSDPAVNADGVTVQIVETQPGKLFTLNLSIPASFQARPNQVFELTLKTTHPKHPVFRVPIVQAAPPEPVVAPKPAAATTSSK